MNAKSIIREIKLSKLLNEPLSGDTLIINNFFDDLFDGIKMVSLDGYPNSIFFIKNGNDFYMEQNNQLDRLYCSNDKIWSFFKDRLGYNELTIKELIKDMVEEYLKQRVNTPVQCGAYTSNMVEEHLKQRVSTPTLLVEQGQFWVEEHLKQRVSTPIVCSWVLALAVEEHLKQRVSTP